ncbi:hypothetical protein JW962_01435 [Candidatus Dojkabacteria bacterium]|nr:hypothetical protein [Candidatus Dojkabacteria bacterium]
MAIVVKSNKALDAALSLLQKDVSRERTLEIYHKQMYHTPESVKKHEIEKIWAKGKRRRRSAAKKQRNRGHL